jgi:hypothetical protein
MPSKWALVFRVVVFPSWSPPRTYDKAAYVADVSRDLELIRHTSLSLGLLPMSINRAGRIFPGVSSVRRRCVRAQRSSLPLLWHKKIRISPYILDISASGDVNRTNLLAGSPVQEFSQIIMRYRRTSHRAQSHLLRSAIISKCVLSKILVSIPFPALEYPCFVRD